MANKHEPTMQGGSPQLGETMHYSCRMPRYKSKKLVWALEIDRIEHMSGEYIDVGPNGEWLSVEIHFTDKHFLPKKVKSSVISRYSPNRGDFFVVYEDGYQSISPRKAFLEGYDRI